MSPTSTIQMILKVPIPRARLFQANKASEDTCLRKQLLHFKNSLDFVTSIRDVGHVWIWKHAVQLSERLKT